MKTAVDAILVGKDRVQSVSGLIGLMYSPDRLRQRLQSITRSTCLVNSI